MPIKVKRNEEFKPEVGQDIFNLEKFFGGQSEAARVLGVDRSQVTRWHRQGQPDRFNIEKIYGVNFVVAKLMTYFRHKSSALKWLEGTNALLNNNQPLELLKAGRYSEVIEAVDQFIAGSYA